MNLHEFAYNDGDDDDPLRLVGAPVSGHIGLNKQREGGEDWMNELELEELHTGSGAVVIGSIETT